MGNWEIWGEDRLTRSFGHWCSKVICLMAWFGYGDWPTIGWVLFGAEFPFRDGGVVGFWLEWKCWSQRKHSEIRVARLHRWRGLRLAWREWLFSWVSKVLEMGLQNLEGLPEVFMMVILGYSEFNENSGEVVMDSLMWQRLGWWGMVQEWKHQW